MVFIFSGFAQGSLEGKISDSKTGQALTNANLWIKELKAGTSSDEEGRFIFKNLSEGKYNIQVTFIGYSDTSISVLIFNNKITNIEINLKQYSIEIPAVIVTATKNERNIKDIPNRIEVINQKKIEVFAGNTVDDYLRSFTGVNVDRFSGIYSKSASITLRGLNSAQRTLILIDGIPMNKTDGGSINWNRIDPENVEKIEVIKGPVSALYGSNGMSGVVNIITKEPSKLNGGDVSVSYGTYNTVGTRARYNFSKITENKGFFGGVSAFYRQGDGYILYPDSTRDSTDIKTYLREGVIQGRLGYQFNSNSKIVAEYGYFDDKRGDGIKIYDADGGYSKFSTHFAKLAYNGQFGKYKVNAYGYLQRENFQQQKESLKIDKLPPFAITQYVLYGTFSHRNDNGIQLNISRSLSKHQYITGGVDIKSGSVNASDIYYTSTDVVSNLGNMNFYALFLQDEASFFNEHLKIIAGIRTDVVKFYNGQFLMEEPTVTTSVLASTVGDLPEDSWNSVSPKLSVQYRISDKIRVYVSAGKGFRPPMLDDLCRNGNISKGLKLANPYLNPEKINSYELGGSWQIFKNFNLEPTVFYSLGTDFQYFVGTGDSIFAGTKMKPILKRQNIGEAEIYGAELAFNWDITNYILFEANSSYYHSIIKEFNVTGYVVNDLTGKELMEVAPYQVNASLWWKNKYVNLAMGYHYKAPQWTDDENTVQANSYSLFDVKISRTFKEKFKVSLSVDNLLNDSFLDEKGVLGIGRFIMIEMVFKFK
jgi:iron complex outermembrane receptor protein